MDENVPLKEWEIVYDGPVARTRSDRTGCAFLRRKTDHLEVKEGSFVLVGTTTQPEVSFVKNLSVDQDIVTLECLMLLRRSKIAAVDVPISAIDDLRFETNEVYFTPEVRALTLDQLIGGCSVVGEAVFDNVVLCESNAESTFVCRRLCDASGSKFTTVVDFDTLMEMFAGNKIEFEAHIRVATERNSEEIKKEDLPRRNEENNIRTHRKRVISNVRKQMLGEDEDDLDDELSFSSASSPASEDDLDDIMDEELYTAAKKRRRAPAKAKSSPVKQKKVTAKDLPELPSVSCEADTENTDATERTLTEAKKVLGINAEIHSLPCRETQFHQLYNEIYAAVISQRGKTVYVSGTPGVGKTATIREVIKQLSAKLQLENDGKSLFNYVEINGLKLVSPQSAYEVLWKKVSGKQVSANAALAALQIHFEADDPKRLPLVVLLDELDQIVTKNQTVMYNFFNWPTMESSKLIVVAVANTMDLPERLLTNKISSRLGLNRIPFTAYTYEQLAQIIRHRLEHLSRDNDKLIIASEAIEFASRKVASVSGDARRSLMICIRAVEIAEMEFQSKSRRQRQDLEGKYTVTIMHIMKAVNETASSPITSYLNSLPFMSKMVLATLLMTKKRLGVAEVPIGDVIDELNVQFEVLMFTELKELLKAEDMDFIETIYSTGEGITTKFRVNGYSYILNELEEAGILAMQQVHTERSRLLRLNVSDDEIMTCFKRDPLVGELVARYGGI